MEPAPHRQYHELLLFPQHEALLAASGISPEVATARGYRSLDTKAAVGRLGFSPAQRSAPALLLPVWSVPTGKVAFYQARPDEPRFTVEGKEIKYETPARVRMALDAHPTIRSQLGDPAVPLWITEGIREATRRSAALCAASRCSACGTGGGRTARAARRRSPTGKVSR